MTLAPHQQGESEEDSKAAAIPQVHSVGSSLGSSGVLQGEARWRFLGEKHWARKAVACRTAYKF